MDELEHFGLYFAERVLQERRKLSGSSFPNNLAWQSGRCVLGGRVDWPITQLDKYGMVSDRLAVLIKQCLPIDSTNPTTGLRGYGEVIILPAKVLLYAISKKPFALSYRPPWLIEKPQPLLVNAIEDDLPRPLLYLNLHRSPSKLIKSMRLSFNADEIDFCDAGNSPRAGLIDIGLIRDLLKMQIDSSTASTIWDLTRRTSRTVAEEKKLRKLLTPEMYSLVPRLRQSKANTLSAYRSYEKWKGSKGD